MPALQSRSPFLEPCPALVVYVGFWHIPSSLLQVSLFSSNVLINFQPSLFHQTPCCSLWTGAKICFRSFLDIKDVKLEGKPVKWSVADRLEPFGSPLSIKLESGIDKGKEFDVDISLSTTDKCTALQWLTPEQTSNKKHPYMCKPPLPRMHFLC